MKPGEPFSGVADINQTSLPGPDDKGHSQSHAPYLEGGEYRRSAAQDTAPLATKAHKFQRAVRGENGGEDADGHCGHGRGHRPMAPVGKQDVAVVAECSEGYGNPEARGHPAVAQGFDGPFPSFPRETEEQADRQTDSQYGQGVYQ